MHDRFKDEWDGEDRRDVSTGRPDRVSSIESLVIKHVHANRMHFDDRMDGLETRLTKLIVSAFPNDDPSGHRRAHEQQIKTADWWSQVKTEAIINLAKSGTWVAVVWMAYAAWKHFKSAILS